MHRFIVKTENARPSIHPLQKLLLSRTIYDNVSGVNKVRGTNPIFAVSTQLMRVVEIFALSESVRGGWVGTAQQERDVCPCDLLHKQFEEQERDSEVVTYPTRSNIKREREREREREKRALSATDSTWIDRS